MKQPRRLAHRQAERNRAKAQSRWQFENLDDEGATLDAGPRQIGHDAEKLRLSPQAERRSAEV